jgi:cyclopropane fatty-acyl-phospholipid synthase-like methyltransferase
MSKSEYFPKLYAGADKRLPMDEDLGLRLGTQCGLGQGSKVADLGCGAGALARLFAKEFGAEVTAVDADEAALADLSASLKADKLDALVKVLKANPAETSLPEGEFQAVVVESGRLVGASAREAGEKARKLLVKDGRLALVTRGKVGLNTPEAVAKFFEERSEPLLLPRDLLTELEQAGFEPLAVEAMPETLLEEYWRFVEGALGSVKDEGEVGRLKREIDIFRREGGRTAVNALIVVARRREPGERPPPARGEE